VRTIRIEIGAGELVDRRTILEIKERHARSDEQRQRLRQELDRLARVGAVAGLDTAIGEAEIAELRDLNGEIWDVEDQLRACEVRREFGPRFVELARSVYRLNDRRALLKRRIDERQGSQTREEKIYSTNGQGRRS
jgi:hypothetical protein